MRSMLGNAENLRFFKKKPLNLIFSKTDFKQLKK